jgi:hypothetical protein
MAIFRESSFLTFFLTVVAVVIVINPVAYGQDEESVVVVYDNPVKCRPAVDEYATCESTGDTWNTKSYCLDSETYSNVLGCCPADKIAGWGDSVTTCRHGSIGWPSIPNSNTYIRDTTTTEDVDDADTGSDSIATASPSSSSLLLSTAMGIAISLVVVIGHYY